MQLSSLLSSQLDIHLGNVVVVAGGGGLPAGRIRALDAVTFRSCTIINGGKSALGIPALALVQLNQLILAPNDGRMRPAEDKSNRAASQIFCKLVIGKAEGSMLLNIRKSQLPIAIGDYFAI